MRICCATLKHSCLFVYQLGRGGRGEIHPKGFQVQYEPEGTPDGDLAQTEQSE